MTMTPGTRLGPYEVVAPLGAGGMGEVWRGRDTRLDRSVAIKVLPAEFVENAQVKLRFEREARTISQLNHPHICTLYDVGEGYLVMELLEGETLADRVARGALPLAEVLKYGIQITEALEKAHKAGVVHRDLKPGNVMITKSGAKLLDFGLAKSGTVAVTDGPTAFKPLTAEGTIVGTFQYMAPEQLEGGEADARTDIFAFGAVLYEMASGRRAFQGKTRTSLIAAIVSGEPEPLSQIQPLAPPSLERLIRKCLAKDPDDRWQCAADLRWELLRIQQEPATAPARRTSRVAWSVAAAALVAAVVLAVITLRPAKAPQLVRFSVIPPAGWTFSLNYNIGPPAVSPDGRYVVFPATDDLTGRSMLWLRDLAASEPSPLGGTEGAGFPFWSPDSASIGFFGAGYLKRIDLSGGSPQALAPVAFGRGGSWSQNNEILFSPSANGSIYRMNAHGGTAQQVTRLDASQQERSHRWPLFLPDGKHFLFLIRRPWTADHPGDSIYVASVDSPTPRFVLEVSSNVAYTEPGYLLYLRDRTLVAQRFNLRSLQLEGEPRPVIREALQYHPAGFGLFSASRSGVLAYGSGSHLSTLRWIDRPGHAELAIAATADYTCPRLSVDQKQLLYSLPDPTSGNLDLWLYDIGRRVPRRVTYHPRDDISALLTPDGSQVIYSSNRSGFPDLFIKSIDASDERLLFAPGHAVFAESVSADGKDLLVRQISASTQNDVYSLPLKGGKPTLLLGSQFNEVQSIFSPTSRWVAYTSNESGRYEVYTCRYPGGGSHVQVSAEGGSQPTWRRDEKELFYIAPGGWIMSVPIDTSGGVLKPGTATRITQVLLRPARDEEREYDVTADGRRFLINSSPPDKRSLPITVVFNWQAELERKSQ